MSNFHSLGLYSATEAHTGPCCVDEGTDEVSPGQTAGFLSVGKWAVSAGPACTGGLLAVVGLPCWCSSVDEGFSDPAGRRELHLPLDSQLIPLVCRAMLILSHHPTSVEPGEGMSLPTGWNSRNTGPESFSVSGGVSQDACLLCCFPN